jgi:hypothetical protein
VGLEDQHLPVSFSCTHDPSGGVFLERYSKKVKDAAVRMSITHADDKVSTRFGIR